MLLNLVPKCSVISVQNLCLSPVLLKVKQCTLALNCQLWAIFCALGSAGTAHQGEHRADQSLMFPHILDKKTPLKKMSRSAEDAQRGNRAHPIHFLACMQKLVVLSSDIRHLCVLLNKAHKLPLGASKMLKGHCAHICTALEL